MDMFERGLDHFEDIGILRFELGQPNFGGCSGVRHLDILEHRRAGFVTDHLQVVVHGKPPQLRLTYLDERADQVETPACLVDRGQCSHRTVVEHVHKEALHGIIKVMPQRYFIETALFCETVERSSTHTGEVGTERGVLTDRILADIEDIGIIDRMFDTVLFAVRREEVVVLIGHPVLYRTRFKLKVKWRITLDMFQRMDKCQRVFPPA